MLKVTTVVGARPQFIKAAAVSRAFQQLRDEAQIEEKLVHTGQHFDANMSESFFKTLQIPEPGVNLGIRGGGHGASTGEMLAKLEEEFQNSRPDFVLVYGDTNTTLAGALAAAKLHIPVAHVEAGLRSFNKRMPEEINRILTDHVSSALFCPTEVSMHNLRAENLADKAFLVGDVMADVAYFYPKSSKPIDVDGPFALCTIHRAENTDSREKLQEAVEVLANSPVKVVLPIHPRTKACLAQYNIDLPENVLVRAPLDYLEMVWALQSCEFVITDSGGLQKEAYFNGKKCVTLRKETEWVELVDIGANQLVDTDLDRAKSTFAWCVDPSATTGDKKIYGNGDAAEKIVRHLRDLADRGKLVV